MFSLSLVLLVCIFACYQEREVLMKNSDELDCREFFKFRSVQHSVVFYCAFAFSAFLMTVEFSSFDLGKEIPFLPLPLFFVASLMLLLESFLSETSRETSMRLRVEQRISKNLDKFPLLFFHLLVAAIVFKFTFRGGAERIIRSPGTFSFAGASLRSGEQVVAYLSIVLRELLMPKTFLGGDQKITTIRKILRYSGILLFVISCSLPFILWK